MCELTLSAWAKGCMDIAGVKALYVVDKPARIAASITYAVANGAITITGTGGAAYKLEPVQNSFAVTNPTNASGDSNSLFYEQTITGSMHANNAATNTLLENINKGRTEWLVEFEDGTYRFFGTNDRGMQANGGDGFASGQASGDAKAANVSLTCQSTYIAPVLESFTSFTDAFTVTEPS